MNGADSRRPSAGTDEGTEPHWSEIALLGDIDWTLVEDRIARSWELVAPTELLEAGGR